MTDLDKAREWAKSVGKIEDLMSKPRAAVEVIQSLPDRWINAEKVAELADDMANWSLPDVPSTTEIDYRHLVEIMDGFTGRINDLLTPPLPTLAELIKQGNDPEQYRWMQAKVFHTEELGCVTNFDLFGECATVLFPNGVAKSVPYEDIAPLPGEPKFEWPGSGDAPTIAQKEKVTAEQQSNTSETPKSSINPEDVPANEPWLIEVDGLKAIGARYAGDAVWPWAVATLDGSLVNNHDDMAVTLIHKLVPEPPALPGGMRLADHEEYGRVVVSPKVDTDDDYKVFLSGTEEIAGATWKYADKSELTFLGGDQRA